MKPDEKLGRAGLYLITAVFLYGMAYMVLRDNTNIRIIPDKWIEKFPVHGEIYPSWHRFHVDVTNTSSSLDSLGNIILPAKADGTRVVKKLESV